MLNLGTDRYFIEGTEEMMMTLTIQAVSPDFYGYSSESYPGVTEVYVHKPGWETNPDQLPVKFRKGTRLENTAFGFRMSVKEWLQLFDMDLDKVYENAGTNDSIGLARARIVGMRLTIRVELRNVRKLVFNAVWPLGNPDLHLYLSKDESWTRNTFGSKPGRTVNELRNTDAYGIRINMLGSASEYLRYPNPLKIFRALIDLVVFLIIFKSLIRLYSFFALGSTSKKWRRALNMNVETHVLLSRDGKHRIRMHSKAIEKADSILVELGMLLMKHAHIDRSKYNNDDIRKFVFSKAEKKRMYDMLDVDGDGRATVEEIKEVLTRFNIAFTQTEIDCIMNILDRSGNGFLIALSFQNPLDVQW